MGDDAARPEKGVTGFQSPADDYIQRVLSLDELLIKRPAATFFLRVGGNSDLEEIKPRDLLLIDRSIAKPRPGSIVLVVIDGAFCLRRVLREGDRWFVVSDCPNTPPRLADDNVEFWGVACFAIHALT